MNVSIALFGAFRDLHGEPVLALDVAGEKVADVRHALAVHLAQSSAHDRSALIKASAFADETRVLRDNDDIPSDGKLAILPPVSGG